MILYWLCIQIMWNCTIAYTYCNIRSSVKWHLCMVRDLIVESRQKKIILFLSFSQDSINKWYLYMYMIHVFWNTVESRIYCFLGGLWFLNEKKNANQRKLIDVEMLELLLAVKLFSRAVHVDPWMNGSTPIGLFYHC